MSLRTKLLLALIPLAAALLLLGGQALRAIAEQGELSQRILKDNYRSVLAAQRMKDSLERIDSAMAFRALGQPEKAAAQDAQNRPLFDAELDVQRHNITEAGEAEATLELKKNGPSTSLRRTNSSPRRPRCSAANTSRGWSRRSTA